MWVDLALHFADHSDTRQEAVLQCPTQWMVQGDTEGQGSNLPCHYHHDQDHTKEIAR